MTVGQAEAIRNTFAQKTNPTEEELFAFTEAMGFLIQERHDPGDMMFLGGVYYDLKNFDLALKYYEMAAAMDYEEAFNCLGYIWYYGRTGEVDYEKAFENFSKSARLGNIQSAYKLADMYKNGYWVQKDPEKYRQIIRSLYPRVKGSRYLADPLPEIYMRLARIDTEEGKIPEAVELYLQARDFLAQRIRYNPFFGSLNMMKWLVEELYRLVEPEETDLDFYDLYELLRRPCRVTFHWRRQKYEVEAVEEDGMCVISFRGQWFRTRDDFFGKAAIGRNRLTTVCHEFYLFEVIK